MKKVLSLILLAIGHLVVNAQIIELAPNNTFSVCPNEQKVYSASMVNGSSCSFFWEITGGTFQGGGTTATGNPVTVTWSSSATSGTLKLTTSSCSPSSNNNQTETKPFAIKSLAGANLGNIGGPPSVNVNVTTSIRYTVSLIEYPRGSSDPNPFYVTDYDWQIPAGWTITNKSYSVSNVQAYIDVKPDNCTGGTIRARAKSSCGNFYSNWSPTLTVNRTIANPGEITGPDFVVCSATDPVQFSIPAVTGATSYVWTKPSGWSGTSTTNSITLTPNGTNGGDVTVKAEGCSLQSSTASVKPVSLELFNPSTPPSITGAFTVCITGSTFSLQNRPINTSVTWLHSSNLTYVSGQGTDNYSVQAANAAVTDFGWVEAVISGNCGNLPQIQKDFWVGKARVDFLYFANSVDEYSYFCTSHSGNTFEVDSETPNVSYEARLLNWPSLTVAYTSTSTYGGNGPHQWNYVPIPNNGYYVFEVRGSNTCGTTAWLGGYEVEYIDCSSFAEGPYAVYPNPTSSTLTIERITPPQERKEAGLVKIELISKDGGLTLLQELREKELPHSIDVSNLPSGLYTMKLFIKDRVETRRIKINH